MTYYNLAYGSNMSLNRLLARLPNAKRIGVASVSGFVLTFDKQGFDDSGKCNALQTGRESDVLFGVLYQLNAHEKARLDEIEGVRYDCQNIQVQAQCGNIFDAYCYVANTLDKQLIPYDWYLKHVLTGAIEAQLPDVYIEKIRKQVTKIDSDRIRAKKEFSIYK